MLFMSSGGKFSVFMLMALICLLGSFFIFRGNIFTRAFASDGQIFICEIKIGGETADDEYIKLCNSGSSPVGLAGWSIKKKKSGGEEESILTDMGAERNPEDGKKISDAVLEIPAEGSFLIVPRYHCGEGGMQKCYLGNYEPDNYYSVKNAYLADNNAVVLYDSSQNPVDTASWTNVAKGEVIKRSSASGGNVSENPGNNNGSGDAETQNGADENAGSEPETMGEKKIIITEILINPVGDDSKLEFVEIYNAGKDSVNLSGWSLEDQSGKAGKYVFPQEENACSRSPRGALCLESGKYMALYAGETKVTLNNSGDGVILKDSTGNEVSRTDLSGQAKEGISFVSDNNGKWVWTTVPTPGEKNVIALEEENKTENADKPSGDNSAANDNEGSENAGKEIVNGSVASSNSSWGNSDNEEQLDFSGGVVINEIFPNPPGKDNEDGNYEWIEIFNTNNREVNLKGWFLDDVLEKGSKPYCFLDDAIIPAKGYLVVKGDESKIIFNNSEEEVSLLWPDNKVEDKVSYKNSKEGFSYNLSALGSWFWTKEKTPAAKNASMPKEEKPLKKKSSKITSYQNSIDFTEDENDSGNDNSSALSRDYTRDDSELEDSEGEILAAKDANMKYELALISEAKKMPLKSFIALEGAVSAPSGIFGTDVFYIIDKNSGEGMQIFDYENDLPSLNAGDGVDAFGFLSEAGGERRLVLDEDLRIKKISRDNLLNASGLDFNDLENEIGNLVKTEGIAETADENIFILNVGNEKIKIYAKPGTGISFGNVKNGERIAVTGHLSRTSAGYRILPRFSTDIRFLKRQSGGIINEEGSKQIVAGYSYSKPIAAVILLCILVVLYRIRMKTKSKDAIRM